MTPKLTIITPSFNQAAFIERTLRSVLDQGYENLEYIVVDGGSSDGSAEIIERYADRLAWWVSEPDAGQTDALNKGLRRATGDIVAYINSDDWYLPGAFEKATATLDANPRALWMAGAARFVGSEDRVWRPQLPKRGRHWWVLDPWGVPQAATFWRREAFDRFGHFRTDMHYTFDTEFGLRLALESELPALLDEELAVRVVHQEAKSWDRTPFEREERFMIQLCKPRLTRGERLALTASRALLRVGFFKLTTRASMLIRMGRDRRWVRSPGPTTGTRVEAPPGSQVYVDGYEPDMTAAVARLTTPGAVCADIGAHFGWFTVLMADRAGREGHVHAFEAAGDNADVVRRNVALNDLAERVSVHQAAVSEHSASDVELFSARAGGSMEWPLVEEFAAREESAAIQTVERTAALALDEVFPEGTRLDLIKMDIEGGEVMALRGARRVLRELRPVIVLEYHREVAWPALEELVAAGYTLESLDSQPLPTPRDTEDVPYQFVAVPPAAPRI